MGKTRLVLDTNVLLSALCWGGNPERILLYVFRGKAIMACSEQQLLELRRVLSYPKFALPIGVQEAFVEVICAAARMVELEDIPQVIEEDPADDVILATAVSGNADFIITGDKHLLGIGSYEGIVVLTPAQFLVFLP